ncbi:MAG: hypothetical protein CSB28_00845 [Desulfobacterales bacterium]|nr:MAG: hypothetical protein CSB28_00845 [Desulfobacterales bacterium]
MTKPASFCSMALLYTATILLFAMGAGCSSSPEKSENYSRVTQAIIEQGEAALKAYDKEKGMETSNIFSAIYFDIFEGSGMEMAIGKKNTKEKVELESYFSQIIAATIKGAPRSELDAPWQKLCTRLKEIGERTLVPPGQKIKLPGKEQ